MNPTSHRPELDLLRRQVVDLARELAERDRVLHERTRHLQVAQALAHLGSWNWDIASGKVEWSDELYRIFGYEPQSREMTFDSFVSAVLPDDHDRVLASIDDALAGAAPYDLECRIVRPDGEVRTIHCCGEVVRDGSSQPLRMSGTALDITDRKHTEAMLRTSQEKLRQALQASATGLWDWNTETNEAALSQEWKRQLGYEPAELADSFETWTSHLHPEDRERAVAYVRDYVSRREGEYRQEFRLQHKDGTYRWIEARASFVTEADGRRIRLLGSHTDITDRKRMEESVQESEERYRTLVELSPCVVLVHCEGRTVFINHTGAVFLGAEDPQDIVDRPIFEFIHPDYHQEVREKATWLLARGVSVHSAERIYLKTDGTPIPVQVEAGRIMWNGKPAILSIFSDITERKRAEGALRASEELGRGILNSLSAHIAVLNHKGVIVAINDAWGRFARANGMAPAFHTGIGMNYVGSCRQAAQEDASIQRMLDGIEEVRMGRRRTFTLEYPCHSPTEQRWFLLSVMALAGDREGVVVAHEDITKHKRAEEALRTSEERYMRATAIGRVGVWELDVLTGQYHGDANLKALFGYASEELSTDPHAWLNVVHPNDRPIAMKNWELVQSGAADASHYELRHIKKDGSIVWGDVRAHAVRNRDGQLTHLIGATVDITERKRIEDALRDSEERFAKAFRTSPHPIGITEMATGRCIEVNDACLQLFGFHREEVIGNTTLMLGIWPNLEDRVRVIERLKAGQPVRNMEFALKTKSGSLRYFLTSADLAELNGTLCVVTVANDITDRKQAEEALRISEERFAKAFRASPHPVVISELDSGRVVDANDAACQLYGYRKEEVVGHTTLQIGIWHSVEERTRYLDVLKRDGSVRNVEVSLRSKSGDVRQCLLSSELIELNGKQCSVTVGDDVTTSKRMERALRRTQFSMDQAVEAILWVDPTARIFNVNETACRMLGYSRQELTTMTVHDIDPNFPVVRWSEHWNHLKEQGALAFDARYWSRTGAVLETEVTFNYLQYDGKEYGCMILRDIGERKRAEAELHRSHTFLRQVIDTDPDFIFAKDREGRFAMANKAVADWYGTTVEDLIGKSDTDFNTNAEEVEFFRQIDLEVILSGRDRFIPEERITDAEGRMRWLQTVKRPIFDDQGRVHMVLGTGTDITERKRMEEMLLQRERDLSAALQERERISQDLHDGILQSLYAIGLGLEACKPVIQKQHNHVAEKVTATLDQAIGQLNQVMTEVRNFIAGLESQVMQGGDFSTALRTMVETMSIAASARCRVRIDDTAAQRISTEQALHIINIVREGVSNALRHSRAKQITVSLRDLIRSDRLAVTDDGIGFNTRSVQGVGHGLINMAARAQKVRGLFAIQSKPDRGTRISLDLPKDTHYAHH